MTRDEIINLIYSDKQYLQVCRRIAHNDELYKDLYQEMIVILLAYDEQKLISIWERREINYFIVGILTRMWHSPRHPFFQLYRSKPEPPRYLDIEAIESAIEDSEFESKIQKGIEDVKRQLNEWKDSNDIGEWYKAALTEQYIMEGSHRKLSKRTGIPRERIRVTVNNTIKELKEKINK